MESEQIEQLIIKYTKGDCSKEEQALLENWYIQFREGENADISEDILQNHLAAIRSRLPLLPMDSPQPNIKHWSRFVAAASIVICIGTGFYFYQKNSPTPTVINAKNDIAPGGNKAYLMLANGKRIILTDAKNGEITEQSGVRVIKTADGQLSYSVSREIVKNRDGQKDYNRIETPVGGQYRVDLPDGTKVWLNAASSLKYPMLFAASERKVELSGEAYFEVTKDKKRPFIVKAGKQKVEVLGTHFNINSYGDEPAVKTTLLEGAVKVTKIDTHESRLLKPGQMSAINQTIVVKNANINQAIAWKEGYFKFYDEDIQSIMRRLSKWYDIEVQYKGAISTEEFSGKISRFKNISQVLKMLEYSKSVHFKIEGRRITVMQ